MLDAVAWSVIALMTIAATARVWHPRPHDADADTGAAGAMALLLGGLCVLRVVIGVLQ